MRFSFLGGGGATVLILASDLLGKNFVGDGARVNGVAGIVAGAAQFAAIGTADCQPDQVAHLPVSVLFHDVDALQAFHEFHDVVVEGERAEAQVRRGNVLFAPQL